MASQASPKLKLIIVIPRGTQVPPYLLRKDPEGKYMPDVTPEEIRLAEELDAKFEADMKKAAEKEALEHPELAAAQKEAAELATAVEGETDEERKKREKKARKAARKAKKLAKKAAEAEEAVKAGKASEGQAIVAAEEAGNAQAKARVTFSHALFYFIFQKLKPESVSDQRMSSNKQL